MKINFYSSSLKIFTNQKEYMEGKILKLDNYFEKLEDPSSKIKVQVEKLSSKNPKKNFECIITIYLPGGVIRTSHVGESVEASFDISFDSLKIQIKKTKDKKVNRQHDSISQLSYESLEEEEIESDSQKPRITKIKRFSNAKPISAEDAIRLMEISNHDFWLFLNADTDRFSVIYKRKKRGEYGIIEPKMARDGA